MKGDLLMKLRLLLANIVFFVIGAIPEHQISAATNYVNDAGKYSYEDMQKDLKQLENEYEERMKVKSLGHSTDGRNIYVVRIGNSKAKKQMIVNASIHGREYLNTYFLMEMVEKYMNEYSKEQQKIGMSYEELFDQVCLYVLPMINPDGVTIAQYGPTKINDKDLRKNVEKKLKGYSYKRWKGNANGVDLNRNFPYGWKKIKNRGVIGSSGIKGKPEAETKVLMKFINNLSNPVANIIYHSSGEVLYWDYNVLGKLRKTMKAIKKTVYSQTKYRPIPKSYLTDPGGGFGDWCVYKKKIASVAIETGRVECPLPKTQYARLYKKNKYLVESITKLFYE